MLGLIRAVGGAASPETVPGTVEGAAGTAATVSKMGRPGVAGNPSWTAAAATGLALAAVTAAAPSLFVVAIVGVLIATLLLGRRGKTIWWSLLPSAAVFLPFVWSAWDNPAHFWPIRACPSPRPMHRCGSRHWASLNK
ncbi:hypothetical protein NHF46_03560 [Arthrobacter alpinus]|nr:hypothetical protein [Arthrobacter alpinus]